VGSLVFVNNRPVTERKVIQAVRVAYRDLSVTGVNPFYVIFLTMPPGEVDVNVHPTKSEVRFRNPGAVFQAVSGAVRRTLQGTAVPAADGLGERLARPAADTAGGTTMPLPGTGTAAGPGLYATTGSTGMPAAVHEPSPLLLARAEVNPEGWRLLGQLHDSYLLVEDDQGLLVVDQHVAHERVLYERYLAGLEADAVSVQGLLVPEVIETEPAAGAILEPLLAELGRMGIELEHFGGSTFLHKGHPDFLEQFDVRPFLDELVAVVREQDLGAADLAREVRQKLLISAACHAAVKINTPLVREKMERLLADLLATENPLYCPHGRPIVLRFPLSALEKSFLRSPT